MDLGVHRETAPVEARSGTPRAWGTRHRPGEGRARGFEYGERGGRDARAGPGAGDRALGGTAAARAVVDVPDQFAAQGRAEDQPVSGEPGDARAGAGLDDGEGRAGALDLAGGGAEEFAGGEQFHTEDGGHFPGSELVPYCEFERFALLGRGPGGLRPGEQGEFTTATVLFGVFYVRFGVPRARAATFLPDGPGGPRALFGLPAGPPIALPVGVLVRGLGQLAQARPAGEGVQPGPALVGGPHAARAAALGEREGVTEGGDRRVVVAKHGQAVREQAVQIRLVARGRALRRRTDRCPAECGRVGCGTVRRECAGGVRGGFRTAAHHPRDRRRRVWAASSRVSSFNPYG